MNRFRTFNRLQTALGGARPGLRAPSFDEIERAEWSFYLSKLRAGMTVFDAGANVGLLTLLFSRFVRENGQVHAFEATASTFERLHTTCDAARCQNVTLNHVALADQSGTLALYVYDTEHASWNSLANRPLADYGIAVQPVGIESVTAITLDDYCTEHAITRVDLLKLDVEGAEYQVLRGAEKLLAAHRIGCCVFEFGQATLDMGNSASAIRAYLRGHGYQMRPLHTGTPGLQVDPADLRVPFSMVVAEVESA